MNMECKCDDKDMLKIVRGNAFAIELKVEAKRLDGTTVEDFDLATAEATLLVRHNDTSTEYEYLLASKNVVTVSFEDLQLGWYGMEMSGYYDGQPWRWRVDDVFQIVETNAKANVPAWSVLTDSTYMVGVAMSLYQGGDNVQADWNEKDERSAAYIKNKPDIYTKSEVDAAIAAEETRAKAAEQENATAIADEVTRATAAEQTNATAIATEETRARAAEQENATAIANEVTRATAAEQTNATAIATEETRARAAEQENATAIANEVTRATAAEQTNATAIATEETRAKAAEQENATAIGGKQDTIEDLAAIRSGAAAGSTAYQKPVGGIPKTDLAEDVLAFEKGAGTNSAKLKGADNTVTGDNSVATGEHNNVSGKDSLVVGNSNSVNRNFSYGFGQYNVINSSNSAVIGTANISDNMNAYAEGQYLRGSGKYSHIEGYGRLNITISGVANSTTYSIVEDLPVMFIGSYIGLAIDNELRFASITAIDDINHTITLTETLNPDRDFVSQLVKLLCSQNLQTAGHVEGKYNLLLINDEITENPLSEGVVQDIYDAETPKVGGHIEGFGNIVCGKYSHAEGSFNLVNKLNAHAEGAYNKALGDYSHVEGRYCETYKNFGHAEGSHAIAEGAASHAEGYYTIARGSRSSAKGTYSVVTGNNAEASGLATVARGTNSHAEGSCNISQGSASHAEGFGNTAWGSCSHAGGDGSLNVVLTGEANATTYATNIQPNGSWIGRLIKPSNANSNAVIYISAVDTVNKTITVTKTLDAENPITGAAYYIALGGAYHANSFAHGRGVVTGGSEQAVFGRYNLAIADALFVVGNGTSYDNPSNAFYIDANGNMYIAGNIVNTQIQQLESRIAALEAALSNNSNN